MMTVKKANSQKFFCRFCGKRMSAGNFTSDMGVWVWSCYACGVSYSQDGKIVKALGTPVKHWVDVPEGSLVVVESSSREEK